MQNKGNAGWAVLGFFFPLVGFILWIVWGKTQPEDAYLAGKGAIIGFALSIFIALIYWAVIDSTIESSLSKLLIK